MNTVQFPRQPHNDGNDDQAVVPISRRLQLEAWWSTFSSPDGWLGRRLIDILDAPDDGLRHMATWIKVIASLAALTFTGLLLWWSISAAIDWTNSWSWPQSQTHTGLLTTLTQPVWDYLRGHTADLQVSATTAYGTWQLFGLGSFLFSWFFRATGARLTWTAWGAATTAMVWAASPASGRTVAAGLAILVWSALSICALRGLSLRSHTYTHVHNDVKQPEVRPQINVPAPVVKRVEINGRELRPAE